MPQRFNRYHGVGLVALVLLSALVFQATPDRYSAASDNDASPASSYIVQAGSAADARRLVVEAGGRVTATLDIIDAVGADLSEEQVTWLRAQSDRITVYEDSSLNVSGPVIETAFPALIGADTLHAQGITGQGITVAVLDTGLWRSAATEYTASGRRRILAQYDATLSQRHDDDDDNDDDDNDDDNDDDDDDTSGGSWTNDIDDWNGHGTHVTSIIMSSGRAESGRYQGVAPDANVVVVRAFEPDGSGTYLNVIKALDWIVSNRKDYDIRVLNLSFGAPAASHYWNDPVNQAVMEAWRRGIIVVAAAGNNGPGPMSIGVPANVPYVITVGAMTDNYTPDDTSDDRLARFSAAGPTIEGFVKPDLVAPGGHMLGQMPPYAWLPLQYPAYVHPVNDYFRMSGTSQAAAVVSGVLALMLEVHPDLRPDDAKCRLMASARAAIRGDGAHAYSVFQQGAGLVDAYAAVNETALGCANRGMSIHLDTWGFRHYAGPAGVDGNGSYYVVDDAGTRLPGSQFEWHKGELKGGGVLWPEGALWNQGVLWNTAVRWDEAASLNPGSLLSQGVLWPEGSLWPEGLTGEASTYLWVEEE